jgi:multidrug efflux system membrane fusion protein
VAFSVPAQQLPDVKRYMAKGPLKVTAAPSTPGAPSVAGTLSFLDNTVDLSTGMIQLKAVFQNERMTLWPGQFVTVTLTLTTRPDTVVVPLTAVQTGQRGLYLFVVKPDQTVESRSVTAGATLGGERIIEQGVQPGEQVVTDGQSRLVPGVKVQVKADAGASVGGSVRGGS